MLLKPSCAVWKWPITGLYRKRTLSVSTITFCYKKKYWFRITDLDSMLNTQQKTLLYLKLKKYKWFTTATQCLSRRTLPNMVSINKVHTKNLRRMQYPKKFIKHCAFQGLCNLYRNFVPQFTQTAGQLTYSLKKGQQTHLLLFRNVKSATF